MGLPMLYIFTIDISKLDAGELDSGKVLFSGLDQPGFNLFERFRTKTLKFQKAILVFPNSFLQVADGHNIGVKEELEQAIIQVKRSQLLIQEALLCFPAGRCLALGCIGLMAAVLVQSLHKAIHLPGGVYDTLLTRKEGVTLGADIGPDHFSG